MKKKVVDFSVKEIDFLHTKIFGLCQRWKTC